jgi:putative transposase
MMQLVAETSSIDGIEATCNALNVSRATYYRWLQPDVFWVAPRPHQPRALLPEEMSTVLEVLHEDRFADLAPAQVYATLLDEKRYLCSERTMYRILAANDEVRERRAQLMHPSSPIPHALSATISAIGRPRGRRPRAGSRRRCRPGRAGRR